MTTTSTTYDVVSAYQTSLNDTVNILALTHAEEQKRDDTQY